MSSSTTISRAPVYVNFVFYAVSLRTNADLARGYTVLILLGVLERLLSMVFDMYPLRIGKLWYLTYRAPLYLAVTILRYVLMIAIMTGKIPLFMVICCGLTLGQMIVEVIRYFILDKKLKSQSVKGGYSSSDSRDYYGASSDLDFSHKHPAVKGQALVDESCC
ncbi:hypothetical protein AYI68_g1829 [Smittium mucronatum]|uniref:Uncharacterized protein n=1 Tax=Smittium mucronatum TaxID=133383 RepID=A0A1R0H4F2_9FUNG|nr:hypothetical protein AYI68_g1829 [Smittium mucronatum]